MKIKKALVSIAILGLLATTVLGPSAAFADLIHPDPWCSIEQTK